MSFYRIYSYPQSDIYLKHVYMKRDRGHSVTDRNTSEIIDRVEHDGRLESSLSRSRRHIRDLVLCNPFEYFCTFTFNGKVVDRYDYVACQKKLRKFFNHFRSRYAPDFVYLIVPDFHKDGAVHFHGLCSGFPDGELVVPEIVFKRVGDELQQVPNTKGYMDWPRYSQRFGFFNCSRIKSLDRCAFYICKYIVKDLNVVGSSRHVYMASLGLKRPELVFDQDDMPVLFKPSFENDYCLVGYTDVNGSVVFGDRSDYPFGFGQFLEADEDFDQVVFDVDQYEQLGVEVYA